MSNPGDFIIEDGILKKYNSPSGDLVIPDSVTSIGYEAFAWRSDLTSVTIPDSVTSIGDRAFCFCESLTSVTIPRSLSKIGNEAFKDCENLKTIRMNNCSAKLPHNVFGWYMPDALINQIDSLYYYMGDGALKNYVLWEKTWNTLDSKLQAEIFLARQGKPLDTAYSECVTEKQLPVLYEAILRRFDSSPTSSDCAAAAGYMRLFYSKVPVEQLKILYAKLKKEKTGARAVKQIEANVALMEKLGESLTVDSTLPPAEQSVMAALLTEKMNTKDLEDRLWKCYSMKYTDQPTLKSAEGKDTSPYVLAWLLTAHEKTSSDPLGINVCYAKPGLRPEAEDIVKMLDPGSLQNALNTLATENLVPGQKTRRKNLSYPICRYADETTMAELTKRALKWRMHEHVRYAFLNAALYNNTRSAMLYAERVGILDKYANMRGMKEDDLRDKYLSDVGLDEHSGKSYDLGNQIVTARLQNDLSFLFELSNGKTAKSLPKKGADEEKFAAAKADYDEMRKAVKKILKSRGSVLFKDFLSGRERSGSAWRESYLNNPLLRKAASLVVWSQGKKTFTLSDDNPVDSTGSLYTITDDAVRVAHPMEMAKEDVDAWQKHFSSCGLKQPFAQVWEPVIDQETITTSRYKNCMIPYYRFVGQEKHGIQIQDYAFHNHIDITMAGCIVDVERIDWRDHDIRMEDRFEVTRFGFKKYTRRVNHIVAYLDRVTVWDRIRKDDVEVMNLMPGFTLAQIMEFIKIAQEANAVNVLTLLLEYKNAHFAGFDPMEEFTLEW